MVRKSLVWSIVIFIIVLAAGAYVYQRLEGWNALDSIYFVVVTVTTLGYGDLVPNTDLGKIFTIFYSFFGIAMAFYFFSLISNNLFKEHLNQKVGNLREKIKKEERVKVQIQRAKSKKRR